MKNSNMSSVFFDVIDNCLFNAYSLVAFAADDTLSYFKNGWDRLTSNRSFRKFLIFVY